MAVKENHTENSVDAKNSYFNNQSEHKSPTMFDLLDKHQPRIISDDGKIKIKKRKNSISS